jgi:hypothetical protein
MSQYCTIFIPDQAILDDSLVERLDSFVHSGGRLVLSGTAGLDQQTKQFRLKGMPVHYVAPAPTVPCYLRPDSILAGTSELATDYDYAFYSQAHVTAPLAGAVACGEMRQALFNRTWEHFISHKHAPVGASLNAPVAVYKDNVLYFAAPLGAGYKEHDYWVYRAIVQNALRHFLPPPVLIPGGPGWVEFTLHRQPASDTHPERRIVHVVSYHPRRSLQGIPHVDQAWTVSGLSVRVRLDGWAPSCAYLAPDRQPLALMQQDGYASVNLPPVGPHTVVVLE